MKKLTIVTTLAVAMLMASPRPASAQFSAFMEWLNSLDPGGFWMFGYHLDVLCYQDGKASGLSAPKTAHGPFCKFPQIPERSRWVFGVEPSFGEGKRNLDPNQIGKMEALSVLGTGAYNYRFGVQFNGGVGFMRFWDPYAGTSNGIARFGVGWSPVVALSKKAQASDKTFLTNVQFRLSATTFFREFHASDFGAPPPDRGFGHEVKLTLGVFFGRMF